MEEIWKDVIGYEGYYKVSNYGQVKSMDRYVNSGGTYSKKYTNHLSLKTGKILKQSLTKRGYIRVSLSISSKTRQYFIHRIVAEAFLEKPIEKNNVNHINGIKTDNRLENLE